MVVLNAEHRRTWMKTNLKVAPTFVGDTLAPVVSSLRSLLILNEVFELGSSVTSHR